MAGLRAFVLRIKNWMANLFGRNKAILPPAGSVSRIRRLSPDDAASGSEVSIPRSSVGSEISSLGDPVTRIRMMPPESSEPVSSREQTVTARRISGATMSNGDSSRRLNITASQQHCPACSEPIMSGESRAQCQRYPNHVVHRKCIHLMKGKCPKCRGQIK